MVNLRLEPHFRRLRQPAAHTGAYERGGVARGVGAGALGTDPPDTNLEHGPSEQHRDATWWDEDEQSARRRGREGTKREGTSHRRRGKSRRPPLTLNGYSGGNVTSARRQRARPPARRAPSCTVRIQRAPSEFPFTRGGAVFLASLSAHITPRAQTVRTCARAFATHLDSEQPALVRRPIGPRHHRFPHEDV